MCTRIHILREGVYQRLTERDRKCVTRSRRENDRERDREIERERKMVGGWRNSGDREGEFREIPAGSLG